MNTVLGCITDDLGNAYDFARTLARSGIDTSLHYTTPQEDPQDSAAIEIIAIHCPLLSIEEAVEQATDALNWLQLAGAQKIFWRFSTSFASFDKGYIGAVSTELMQLLNTKQTVYCPTIPEAQQTVTMGKITDARIPLNNATNNDASTDTNLDSDLIKLLITQVANKDLVGLINHTTVSKGSDAINTELTKLAQGGIQHVLCDASSDEDLTHIAKASLDFPLLTGSIAFANTLPNLYLAKGLLHKEEHKFRIPQIEENVVVLSGSGHEHTFEQINHYMKEAPSLQLTSDLFNSAGLDKLTAWYDEHIDDNPLLYIAREEKDVTALQKEYGAEKADKVMKFIVAKMAEYAFMQGTRRFIVAGEETVKELLGLFQVLQMRFGPAIQYNLPWIYTQYEAEDIAIAIKTDDKGSKNYFSEAITSINK